MLAKSNLDFNTHCEIVRDVALGIFNSVSGEPKFINAIEYGALLHDIGKLTTGFQKMLRGESDSSGYKFAHNQIGWAYLNFWLSKDFPDRDDILNIVHWHHGVDRMGDADSFKILNGVDTESLSNMRAYLEKTVGYENVVYNEEVEYCSPPKFYPTNLTTKLYTARSFVISADRLGSDERLTNVDDINIENIINEYIYTGRKYDLSNSEYSGARYEKQLEIASTDKNNTIVNAPAGFGKTLTGLIWGIRDNKKLIWVTPRNAVAESVYDSVIKELAKLGVESNVQLLLSSEVKRSNNGSDKVYDADIIITNIDNFLAPSFRKSIMDLSALLLTTDVVFDEYHELSTEDAYMALFIKIMESRRMTNSRTLLLSATPNLMEMMWNKFGSKNNTVVLPKKHTHFDPVHNKPYNITVVNTPPIVKPNSKTLVVKNSIKNSQDMMDTNVYDKLLHSDFLEDRKHNDLMHLIGNFGKNGTGNNNILGTPLIQASVDVSFKTVVEDVLSPLATLQRIGRCNRWGTYNSGDIILHKYEGKSPSKFSNDNVVRILYDTNLYKKWVDFISTYSNKSVSLQDIYDLYNKFQSTHEVDIVNYNKKLLSKSIKNLERIYPRMYKSDKSPEHMVAGSNLLRCNGNETFFIVRNRNGEWVGLFTHQIRDSYGKDFNEEGDMLSKMKKTMKNLSNDARFNYGKIHINKIKNIDMIREIGKFSDTPYIRYDVIYDETKGLIKE